MHALQVTDPVREIGPAVFGQRPGSVAAVGTAGVQVQQLLDLVEGEAKLLGAFDEPQQVHRRARVVAVAARRAGRLSEQPAALVVAQRLGVHSGLAGQLAGSHASIVNPGPRYRVKTPSAAVLEIFDGALAQQLRRD